MSSMPQRDWFEIRAMVHSIGPSTVTLGSATLTSASASSVARVRTLV